MSECLKEAQTEAPLLPQTVEEFHEWAKEIYTLAGLVRDDNFDCVLAQTIQRSAADKDRAPYQEFVSALRKARANHAAFEVLTSARMKASEEKYEKEQETKLGMTPTDP